VNADVLDTLLHQQLPLAARGDRAAYGRIVAASQSTVSAIALAIVRDVPASEDIAQEAFLSAWQNLRKLNNPTSFLPWLRQITRNLARDHLRAQYHRANPAGDIEAMIAAVADPGGCPADQLSQHQDEALAAEVIDALPVESREVLLLYYREGQSSKQVASLLGMQDAAVRKRLSRARQAIREELLQRLGEFARASAPGTAFTAIVVAGLATGAPGTAAAAMLASGSAVAGKGFLKLLGASAGAAALGIIGGLAGIWLGIRKFLADPLDGREKRELLAWGLCLSVVVVAFTLSIIALTRVPGWLPHVAVSVAYALAISIGASIWLPRILQRRNARDLARDPVATAARLRREKFWGRIGATSGLLLAAAGLVFGLVASGRIFP
jgi:RNA polymerase sigma factor (sigma-70 family)